MFSKTLACAIVAVLMLGGAAYAQPRDEDRGPPGRERHDDRNDRGAGPHQEFHRGGRLPPEYHRSQDVVGDWRGHHLSAPPRGYHGVQNGNDFLLVAVTTGLTADIILNH